MAAATVKENCLAWGSRRLVGPPLRLLSRLRGSVGWLSRPLEAVRGAIYPPLCLACDADLDGLTECFCAECLGEMAAGEEPACQRCALRVGPFVDTSRGCVGCAREHHRFDASVRFGSYAGKLRDLLLSFKSVQNELLGPALVREFMRTQGNLIRSINAQLVISVPLHFVRRLQRGFNQAESLARCFARELNLPHGSRILKRVRRTRPQSELKREERRDNVCGAFAARANVNLKGATILLVDDILTTGATCSEAARALKAAGAARVVVAVIARSQEQTGG